MSRDEAGAGALMSERIKASDRFVLWELFTSSVEDDCGAHFTHCFVSGGVYRSAE